ncbi:MAG: hypothetical protein HOP23_13600 [Methylococcaceae bacterium]|nr:hypothetical protein [Methylococcaceae bacterium]
MQFTENATPSDLLAEITRLEDQISKLSLQLDTNHETIELLRQALVDRESRIHVLESNLVMTPKFLLQTTLTNIVRVKNDIKDGIDTKIINPVLAQIRQQLELVERLIDEARLFLSQSKQIIYKNIHTALEFAHKSPDQARIYFEKTIVEPILSLVHRVIESSNRHLQAARIFVDRKLISPSRSIYDQAVDALLALPTQSQVIFQIQFLEPTQQTINRLIELNRQLFDDSMIALKNLLLQLKHMIEQGLAALADYIKKSQFWDGKRPVQAMA